MPATLRKSLAAFRAKRTAVAAHRQRMERFATDPRGAFLSLLQHNISTAKNWPRKADPKITREGLPHIHRGWLLPTLIETDDRLTGRWDYWARTMQAGRLLDEPIPPLRFCEIGHSPARRMLENALNHIPPHGSWQTWGSTTYIDYFLDWLLYGFGYHPALPEPPASCEGACSRLYQTFCLEAMLAWPHDYFGDLLAETSFGRGAGFYPTPLHVCTMMATMIFGDGDCRAKAVSEPCVGTGRMLLAASNYSMRLYGMDILQTCVKATVVNLYLYAPWGAKPIPFLDETNRQSMDV